MTKLDNNKQIIFHIGLRKTGTTFLQSEVFPNLTNIDYGSKKIITLAQSINNIILISNEGLSGIPYNTKNNKKISYLNQFKRSIKNLNLIFPEAKFIICFREPSSLILSNYKQYLHEGGTLSFDHFFNLNHTGLLDPKDFMFSRHLNFLLNNYDHNKFHIFLFKDILNHPKNTIKEIVKFIAPENVNENMNNINTDNKKQANPSVLYTYEKGLIRFNKINNWLKTNTPFSLQIKLFGKILNPRVFFQYILPKLYKPKNDRCLSEIKDYYLADWQYVLDTIQKIKIN